MSADDDTDPILRGPLGRLVMMTYGRTEADPVAVIATLATLLATSIGSGPRVRIGADEHPIRLHTLIVGGSGTGRKGTSWTVARRLAYCADHHLEHLVKSGFGSGESIIDSFVTADNGDQPDHRMLIHADEFSRMLSVASRTGDTSTEVIRESWSSDRLQARARQRSAVCEASHLNVLGHVTPADLAKHYRPEMLRNGFLGRFLFVRSVGGPHVPAGGADWLTRDIADAAAQLGSVISANRMHARVPTPEVVAWWESEIYPVYDQDRVMAPDPLDALAVRWEAYCWRLAGLAAVCEGSKAIERSHLEWALAMWRHSWQTVNELYSAGGLVQPEPASPANRDRMAIRKLVDLLLPHVQEAGITGLTGTQVNRLLGGRLSGTSVAEVRQEGVRLGLWADLMRESASGSGRPTRVLVTRDPS